MSGASHLTAQWLEQVGASFVWTTWAFLAIVLISLIVGALVFKTIGWGRQIWPHVKLYYFTGSRAVIRQFVFWGLIYLNVFDVRVNVLFNKWYRGFYDSLQGVVIPGTKDATEAAVNASQDTIYFFLFLFFVLAAIYMVEAITKFFVQQRLGLHWREGITADMQKSYIKNKAYFRSLYLKEPMENPDQRMQSDTQLFTQNSLTLYINTMSSMLTLYAFIPVLWGLAFKQAWDIHVPAHFLNDWVLGGIDFQHLFQEAVKSADYTKLTDLAAQKSFVLDFVRAHSDITPSLWDVSYAPVVVGGVLTGVTASLNAWVIPLVVWGTVVYVLVASIIGFQVGKPLIRLNFLDERFNASYRYSLIRMREYAESVAFYRGEKVETRNLDNRFTDVVKNYIRFIYANVGLQSWNFFCSQTSVLFPYILQMSAFMAGKLKLGGLIQTGNAFGQVYNSLSIFIQQYSTFAQYRATLDRLENFYTTVEVADALPVPQVAHQDNTLEAHNVNVYSPDGRLLIKDLSFSLEPGQYLLLRGPSGSGKTTLLRTLAGLWPYSEGEMIQPAQGVMFLSQKPYLPEGDIMDVLFYPSVCHDKEAHRDQVAEVMQKVRLSHLVPDLLTVDNWTGKLSLGEQQRVAMARLLLAKPDVAFIDEATSAMDEPLENEIYTLIHEELPNARLVSVGHRSSLLVHHDTELVVKGKGEGGWEINKIDPKSLLIDNLEHVAQYE